MKRFLLIALTILTLLGGVACLAYPYISEWTYQLEKEKVVEYQQSVIAQRDEDDLAALREEALDYNRRLLSGKTIVIDPFDPDREQGPGSEEYAQVMNVAGDGVMGTLAIPCVDIELPVYHGTSDESLDAGAGHLENTSLPIGGKSSHCVIAAHSGLPSKRMFDRLEDVEVGDWFVLQVLGEDHAYRVYSREVVLPSENGSLSIQVGKDLVTLVTCTPYGVNDHRLLVHAKRCAIPQEWLDMQGQVNDPSEIGAPSELGLWFWSAIGGVLALAVLAVAYAVMRRRGKRKKNRNTGE